jgi:sec-independent protein translocase protein TatA
MPNLGAGEILVILLLALLVLGPDKLPGAAKSIGKGMGQFRRLSQGFEQEVRNAMHAGDTDVATPTQGASPQAASPQSTATPSTLHPGLGPGPRLGPGAVNLNGQTDAAVAQTDARVTGEGPAGSFS